MNDWQSPTNPPDEGVTVLIGVPEAAEPVWPGYLEDGVWYWENGQRVSPEDGCHVVCWKHFDELPEVVV